jgi:chromosome segregation ATPase
VSPELSLWQRVDALRELLHQGGLLLGEVVTLAQNAEESLAAAAAEKKILEQSRRQSEEECLQLRLGALTASEEAERQRSSIAVLRQDAERSRSVSSESSQRIAALQAELAQLRRQAPPKESSPQDSKLIADLRRSLQAAETRLEQVNATLATERERRNRAISLIKPVSPEPPELQTSPAT